MNGRIKYYSTNHQSEKLYFRDVLLMGQAPDKGLFMPESFPSFDLGEIDSFSSMRYSDIAFNVAKKVLIDEVPEADLKRITADAYDFDVPLEHVYDRTYVMRLDQGPTASFKDFAARMMARLMQHFLLQENRKLLILTATSGDTGSAIAHAFYGLDNIKIVVLFPINEVSARQRKQMTTLGKNITTISIDGKFDDCQAIVKEAFADPELSDLSLSSANSINFGRLLPQTVYYFYAYSKLKQNNEKAIFCVPSGNFGDMMGGIFAFKMGLPVERFIVATNENDEFPEYMSTGVYNKIVPSKNCLSSAMNVGHPSNLARLIDLYGGQMDEKGNISKQADLDLMRKELYSISITNSRTKETIKSAYEDYKLLLEPHGSVGWAALQDFNKKHDYSGKLQISLETAHPAKFPELIREILNIDPKLPPSLEGIEDKKEHYQSIETNYSVFKDFLKKNYTDWIKG